jgi:hypothetical protein
MKRYRLKIALLPVLCFCVSVSCGGSASRPAVSQKIEAQKPENDYYRAGILFSEDKHVEALPILERLVNANPSDDQAVFGLGVALIYAAWSEKNAKKRRELVIRARQTLIKATELGAGAEDYFLVNGLRDLPANGDDSKTKGVKRLAELWLLHPPEVFDVVPPEGIKLPEGYRHKASTDFEGRRAGTIWKKGGLKIHYASISLMGGGDAVKYIEEADQVWRRKMQTEDFEFVYVLTKDNKLTISTYRQGGSYVDFYAKVSDERDVEEVLSITKGLKPEKRKQNE